MYIKTLSIRNFRNFHKAKFSFSKDCVNTIVGENSAGKTNVFEAMRLIIDDSLPRYKKFLLEKDFHRGLDFAFGHWVIVTIELDDIKGNEETEVLCQFNVTPDAGGCGRVTYIYRPSYYVREQLYRLNSISDIDNRRATFDDISNNNQIDKTGYEAITLYQGCNDLLNDEDYVKIVGDFNEFKFSDPKIDFFRELGHKPRGYSLQDHVGCTYARALRDVVTELKSNRHNPFQKLLDYISKDIHRDEELSNKIKEVNKKISEIDKVGLLSDGIFSSISNAVSYTYSPNLSISSELPVEIKDLIRNLQLKAGDSISEDYTSDISEMSLGGANLIYLALKLYEYEEGASKKLLGNFLIIEEPEAHIHTHIQKSLFSNLTNKKTQIFISTHSTHISSISKISSVNVITKINGASHSSLPSNGLDTKVINRIERFLDAIRSDILFAKSVILIEGDAEEILIPHLIKNALGVSLDELGISLISVRGTGFEQLSLLFHNDRIRKKCAILTDNDVSIYSEQKPQYATDYEYKKSVSSAKTGLERKEKLEILVNNSCYLKSFYTRHTFEVDLAISGAKSNMLKIAEESYSKESFLVEYREAFLSDDHSRIGTYALRLANKHKKGWFAMLLAETVDSSFPVPLALCDAISFSSSLNPWMIKKIINHRLNYLGSNEFEILPLNKINTFHADIKQLSKEFMIAYPTDPFTRILCGTEYGC